MTTISGLHACKVGNTPYVGDVKTFVLEERTGKSGKPWTKIRAASADQGGRPYEIMSVAKTDYTDAHQNISFNLEIVPVEISDKRTEPARPLPDGAVRVQTGNGGDDPRHRTMRAANLLLMCHKAAKAVLGENADPEDARSLFIYMSREGYVAQMPDKPLGKQAKAAPEPVEDEARPLDSAYSTEKEF